MLDLTKPIRRKRDGVIVKGYLGVVLEDQGGRYAPDDAVLMDAYENVPEPRKPREWWIHLDTLGAVYPQKSCVDCTRVIEWPENAPLPEWPE